MKGFLGTDWLSAGAVLNIVMQKASLTAGDGYSSVILSSAEQIRCLQPLVRQEHATQNPLLDLEFFLSSISREWRPRVAAVRSGEQLRGVIYGKERMLSTVSLGIIYADLSFGSMLFGDAASRSRAFLAGLESMLNLEGIRGVRLRICPNGPEAAAIRELTAAKRLDTHYFRVKDHACLSLPDTYLRFLQNLGSTTRHNFRHYRRRLEAAGHIYLESLTLTELCSAASYLRTSCSIPSSEESISRLLNMVSATEKPLAVGLRHRDGDWLSVIGGVYTADSGVLLLQLNNDVKYPRDSLSLVLRAYLIESLIRQKLNKVIIWGGTAPPLSRYVTSVPTIGVHLDVPSHAWRVARSLISTVGPWLPKRFHTDVRWVAPFR